MRIAIDIRPLLDARWSGVANYAAQLTRGLLELPRPDRNYALFGSGLRCRAADLWPATPQTEVRCQKWPNKLLNATMLLTGRPRMEDMCGGADIVYLPNLNFVATRKPLIVTVHDLSFRRYPEFFSAKQRLWHEAVRPTALLRRADAVVAVSEHTKKDIVESFGLAAEKITVVSPGVGTEVRAATAAEISTLQKKYRLPDKFFLFLGTLEPRKNVVGLVAAFTKAATDAHLVIAGGRGWLYREIFSAAAASSSRERIHFIDYVDEADKSALYSAALALVYPSFYEGFGLPPLEAMACGTPVIASHATSLGEVIGDAGLLVDPHNTTAIAEGMREIERDETLRLTLTQRGLKRSKFFSWKNSAEKLDAIIGTLRND